MSTYYRIQETGFTWAQTLEHSSRNWGEETTEGAPECGTGICACTSEDDLLALIDEWFGAYPEELDNQEILVFRGLPLRDVGDGWLVEPLSEIERIPAPQFVDDNS
jgi:hypothetical protein